MEVVGVRPSKRKQNTDEAYAMGQLAGSSNLAQFTLELHAYRCQERAQSLLLLPRGFCWESAKAVGLRTSRTRDR